MVADWIEANLVHGEGDFYGEPFLLDPFQRELLNRLYLVDAETRRRVVRRALLLGPKGWGKTELDAAVALAELCGPTTVNSKLKAAVRRSPNIPIAAASWEQSDRLFEAAYIMATHPKSGIGPFLEPYETEIRVKNRPGRLFRVAAIGGTNEGGLPTAFVADELHEWRLPRQRRLHLVIGNSLAKRSQGLELNISTPDDADPESLLGNLVAYAEKVAAGEILDPTFLYLRYGASEKWDIDNPAEMRKAIVEATPASWMHRRDAVESVAARYEVDHIPEHEFRRYHLGQLVRPEGYWIPKGAWEPLKTEGEVDPGTRITLGFDGSYNHDSTALVGCTLEGHLFVLACIERPENAPEGWAVPRAEVDAAVHKAFSIYDVVEMACDPAKWTSEIQEWADRYGERVVIDFPQTPNRMVPATGRFYAAVLGGQGISHDGDARLSRHLHNAATKEHRAGVVIVKAHENRKIDLAVAAVMAYDRAMVRANPPTSVYEDRGLTWA